MGDIKTLHELLSRVDSRFLNDRRTLGDLSPEEALECQPILQKRILLDIENVKRAAAKVQQELAKQRNSALERGAKKNNSITDNKIEGGVRSKGGAFAYNPLK